MISHYLTGFNPHKINIFKRLFIFIFRSGLIVVNCYVVENTTCYGDCANSLWCHSHFRVHNMETPFQNAECPFNDGPGNS